MSLADGDCPPSSQPLKQDDAPTPPEELDEFVPSPADRSSASPTKRTSIGESTTMVSSPQRRPSGGIQRRRNSRSQRSRNNSMSIRSESADSTDSSDYSHDLGTSSSPATTIRRRKKRKRHVSGDELFARKKTLEIEAALVDNDTEKLKELAMSRGGLLNDDLRRRAWPRLVGITMFETSILPTQEEVEQHSQYNQVVLDVNRSLKRFPPGIAEEERPGLQDQLTRLIIRVLMKHPELHYYQGYHDVAITFLLVVGEELGFNIVEKLSQSHLKEFMAPTMERTTYRLHFMYPMIHRVNPKLHDYLDESEVGTIFALPWLITWFGHVLPNYDDVVRLYDFFLSRPPMMPVYLATAMVLRREGEILMNECDMAMMHSLLSRIPVNLQFEKLLVDSQKLYDKFPPETLETDVQERVKRITEAMKPKKLPVVRKKGAFDPSYKSMIRRVFLVTAPVIIGVFVWRYYNSFSGGL